jgi:hypothetical protein
MYPEWPMQLRCRSGANYCIVAMLVVESSVTFLAAKALAAANCFLFRPMAFKNQVFWRGLAAFR